MNQKEVGIGFIRKPKTIELRKAAKRNFTGLYIAWRNVAEASGADSCSVIHEPAGLSTP
jgi:hypothetical protein